jgi:hypothetical protein
MYYLDAPHATVRRLTAGYDRTRAERHLLIADLHHVPMAPAARAALADLAGRHAVWVWNRRFIAVDLASLEPSLQAYAAVEHTPTALWRWFVNPARSPIAWAPDPDPEVVAGLFAARPAFATSVETGGSGGSPFEGLCPAGQTLSGLQGRVVRDGRRVSALRPVCAGMGLETSGPWLGEMPEEPQFQATCGPGRRVRALVGRAGAVVESIGAVCETVGGSAGGQGTPVFGASAAPAFSLECPAGSGAVGLAGRSGAAVDALALRCAPM